MERGEVMKKLGLVIVAIAILAIAMNTVMAVWVPPEQPEINNSSIRIYGECGYTMPDVYNNWTIPFNPEAIPKDSVTFNPALIPRTFEKESLKVDGANAREKVYLRMWYEPCGHYYGNRKDLCMPSILTEYTYMLISTNFQPLYGHAKAGENRPGNELYTTNFAFPVEEIDDQWGLGHLKLVTLYYVNNSSVSAYGKTSEGEVWIEMAVGNVSFGSKVQFLDHSVEIVSKTASGKPVVRIYYEGNPWDEIGSGLIFLDPGWYIFDRHNNYRYVPLTARSLQQVADNMTHPDVTWYIRYEGAESLYVGKALKAGDVFYVKGVRYEIPAIETLDTNGDYHADAMKYITIRAKMPKGDGDEVREESVVSSQWIITIPYSTPIPVLPPFNGWYEDYVGKYIMIDDVNVPLWYYMPDERCYTKQPEELWNISVCKPYAWVDGKLNVTNMIGATTGEHKKPAGFTPPKYKEYKNWTEEEKETKLKWWIAYDVSDRLAGYDEDEHEVTEDGYIADALVIYWIREDTEWRYSTNLLEKLEEIWNGIGSDYNSIFEFWGKFDIQSLPDKYTEFVLPAQPDVCFDYNQEVCNGIANEFHGDYLITTSFVADQAKGDFNRLAFAYDPVENEENGVGDGDDIYVNYDESNGVNTVRIYGADGKSTCGSPNCWGIEVYNSYDDVFNPTCIIKDSITFDAAKLKWSSEFPMSAQNENIDLKVYLRAWYVPKYEFYGEHNEPEYNDAVVVEHTYMIVEAQDETPFHGSAGDTWIAFPVVADYSKPQIGLDSFENSGVETLDYRNLVLVSYVNATCEGLRELHATLNEMMPKTTKGIVRLEKTYIMNPGDTVKFFDHQIKFEGWTTFAPKTAKVTVEYIGNYNTPDMSTTYNNLQSGVMYVFDRNNVMCNTSESDCFYHPERTFYIVVKEPLEGDKAVITVGKELAAGDVFYVDGVRYEIPAIEVLGIENKTACSVDWANCTPEKFKFITIRAVYPKDVGAEEGVCSPKRFIMDSMERNVTGCCYPGKHLITSQKIAKIPPCCPIPVLPPFNMEHTIVDDTDVALWMPLKHLDKWPWGDPNGRPGVEYFPNAERYLTMQYPPITWLIYFRAVPIDTDGDLQPMMPVDEQLWEGPYYPFPLPPDKVPWLKDNNTYKWNLDECGVIIEVHVDNQSVNMDTNLGSADVTWWVYSAITGKLIDSGSSTVTLFDPSNWIANDVDEREIDNVPPLEFCWKEEFFEPRYTTNLLEILNENETKATNEFWTKYDIQTYPDNYTAFKLPMCYNINPTVYINQRTFTPDQFRAAINMQGCYIITTSLLAPNALGDLNKNQIYRFLCDVDETTTYCPLNTTNRFAFAFNPAEGTGLYVNENPAIPPRQQPGYEKFTIALEKGDNFVSIPVQLTTTDPKAVFGPDTEVWEFDGTKWVKATTVEPGKGYYVYSPMPKRITVQGPGVSIDAQTIYDNLSTGWNLVGIGNKSVKVSDLLELNPNLIILEHTGISGMEYMFMTPEKTLEPTKSYWIYKPS